MRYEESKSIGEIYITKEFEGEPKEILELIKGINEAEQKNEKVDSKPKEDEGKFKEANAILKQIGDVVRSEARLRG